MKFLIRPALYLLAFATAYYITYLDALTGDYAEGYSTEVPQEMMLLAVIVLHVLTGRRYPFARQLNYLGAGFWLACLIREHNNQLSDLFFHSAWVVGVVPVLIATAIYGWRRRADILADYQALRNTFGFGVLTVGFVTLHLFSRLYGANDLWRATMGDDYLRVVARTSEEGIELLAYTIILIGTVELVRTIERVSRGQPDPGLAATERALARKREVKK